MCTGFPLFDPLLVTLGHRYTAHLPFTAFIPDQRNLYALLKVIDHDSTCNWLLQTFAISARVLKFDRGAFGRVEIYVGVRGRWLEPSLCMSTILSCFNSEKSSHDTLCVLQLKVSWQGRSSGNSGMKPSAMDLEKAQNWKLHRKIVDSQYGEFAGEKALIMMCGSLTILPVSLGAFVYF